ncbi:hypothetical protein [Nitrosomonas ureae]|uniref:HNH endonuclease n=1 Tax=Nitrosomonas ureae TaxID=44577 RepID=A0A286ALK0_9PROT|nr:hypothetical protein [Nitrosomonas ureae]SOD22755.1 hypothetical protein SAMN06297164_3577 [Nitrosomonas ureae]
MFPRPKINKPFVFQPANKCIYCGKTNVFLGDEHIIPFSLDGAWIIPKASCKDCESITSKFEMSVARDMYLQLRTKEGFQTRRKWNRPKYIQALVRKLDGTEDIINIDFSDYPSMYPVFQLPPPGILNGNELSELSPDGMRLLVIGSPEEMKSFDEKMNSLVAEYQATSISINKGLFTIKWSHFYRMLAKIAHAITIGHFGTVGFTPLLPPLILGTCPHLTNLIGGKLEEEEPDPHIIKVGDNYEILIDHNHIIVNIDIMNGRCPTYSVVAGYITDLHLFLTNASHLRQNEKKECTHGMRTRYMFIHEWVFWIVKIIRAHVNNNYSHFMSSWPLLNGYAIEAYAIPPNYYLLILTNTPNETPTGPSEAINLPYKDHPDIPPKVTDLNDWENWCRSSFSLSNEQWPILLPVRDSGISEKAFNGNDDLKMFSEEEKTFFVSQINYLIETQLIKTLKTISSKWSSK